MANTLLNSEGLAAQICAEVEALFPESLGDRAARSALQVQVEHILASRQMGELLPESRRVTILLSDIRGFTAIAETYSAMTVVELLNRYFARMSRIIVSYGGTIDKLMGDSIMVLFGAPTSEEDDVERAVGCAVAMQQAMSEFNEQNMALDLPELFMGIGINTGEVVAGPVGSDLHREYTVIGDEVNLTSRIEAQSLRGQILISENTYRLARPYVLVGDPNRVQVKGKKQPVCLYELLGTTRPRTMTVPRREIRKSPRVDIAMPCYFQRVENKRVLPDQYRGEVQDIGYHGLQMVSPLPLERYSEIRITVSLELLSRETTDIYARIIQSQPTPDGHLCSLEFTAMDRAGQSTIKRFVDQQIYQS